MTLYSLRRPFRRHRSEQSVGTLELCLSTAPRGGRVRCDNWRTRRLAPLGALACGAGASLRGPGPPRSMGRAVTRKVDESGSVSFDTVEMTSR